MDSDTNDFVHCSSCGCSMNSETPFCDPCSQNFQNNSRFFKTYALYLEIIIPPDWNIDNIMLAIYIREHNLSLQVLNYQRTEYIADLRNGYFEFLNMFADMEIENDHSDNDMVISIG